MAQHTALWAGLATTLALTSTIANAIAAESAAPPLTKSVSEILASSPAGDWRPLDPENTIYMDLPGGRVVIELAPKYAPLHVANIKTLVHEHYFDGTAVIRSQDNFVAQWGDPSDDVEGAVAKPIGSAKAKLAPEFTAPIAADMPFSKLPDGDIYAPEVGFSDGFPVARDPKTKQTWLTHCYGAVGVGRGLELDSGGGTSLYAVNGQPIRQLDRNIAVVGRVVQGMEWLSTLPRGTGPLGFYEDKKQYVPISSAKLEADVPENERLHLQVLRTDSATFAALTDQRRHRHDDFYVVPPGHIELCSALIPVRPVPAK
jgi:peptidylprolyl isomerase